MSQSNTFGRPKLDIGAMSIASDHLSSINHTDNNIIAIEKDIYDLQEIVIQNTEFTTTNVQEIATIQNELVDLQYNQTLPWFCKSNFVYHDIPKESWSDVTVPDAANQLFLRHIDLDETFTHIILFLPRVSDIGEARHVSVFPKSSEACVCITTDPANTVRLSSFDIEWFPPAASNQLDSDVFVGHKALLSKPRNLNGYVFGSSTESKSQGQCVIFPNAGAFYIQSIYIDNTLGHSRIILVGQKYQQTFNKTLLGFSLYGFQ